MFCALVCATVESWLDENCSAHVQLLNLARARVALATEPTNQQTICLCFGLKQNSNSSNFSQSTAKRNDIKLLRFSLKRALDNASFGLLARAPTKSSLSVALIPLNCTHKTEEKIRARATFAACCARVRIAQLPLTVSSLSVGVLLLKQ